MLYLAGLAILSTYYYQHREPMDVHVRNLYRTVHLNPRVHDAAYMGIDANVRNPVIRFQTYDDRDTWTFHPLRPMTFHIQHKETGLYLTMAPSVRHRLQGTVVLTQSPNAWSTWELIEHPDRRLTQLSFAFRLRPHEIFTRKVRISNQTECTLDASGTSESLGPGSERVVDVPVDDTLHHELTVRVPSCNIEWSIPGTFLEEEDEPPLLLVETSRVTFKGRVRSHPPRVPQYFLHADQDRLYIESRFHTPRAMWLLEHHGTDVAFSEQHHVPEWLTSTIRPRWVPSPEVFYVNLYWWVALAFLITLLIYLTSVTYAAWRRA